MKEENKSQQTWLIIGVIALVGLCICAIAAILVGREVLDTPFAKDSTITVPSGWDASNATLTIAVSPGMAATLKELTGQFNALAQKTPDGTAMTVNVEAWVPQDMIEASLQNPPFQAIAPDSSLWLNQLDRQWAESHIEEQEIPSSIPIGNRRFSNPTRYAISPVVIVAWEDVARELGWPEQAIGWGDIQQRATSDSTFKWNHPSTGHASGLLATLAEFYAGAGLTRGLTPEAATAQTTLDYVRNVESTIRFYGEAEDVIVQRLNEEGRNFLDAFVAQEQTVIDWNQEHPNERIVAIYPKEGTLWADHPLALLELGAEGELPLTDNQRHTYNAFAAYLTGPEAQKQLLDTGYRPTSLKLELDSEGSPFNSNTAVDWRQPQTTLQIPTEAVVEVVQNVWWYTKRPTNVYLVVDSSGSMEEGGKLERTKEALHAFVEQIRGDRDQVGLILFSNSVEIVRASQSLDETGREDLQMAIENIEAQGQTALIDGVWEAHTALLAKEDSEAINAIVLMTDGQENSSWHSLSELKERFAGYEQPIVVFTIAFGSNADEDLLRTIAQIGNGQFYRASETDIENLYKIISTYF